MLYIIFNLRPRRDQPLSSSFSSPFTFPPPSLFVLTFGCKVFRRETTGSTYASPSTPSFSDGPRPLSSARPSQGGHRLFARGFLFDERQSPWNKHSYTPPIDPEVSISEQLRVIAYASIYGVTALRGENTERKKKKKKNYKGRTREGRERERDRIPLSLSLRVAPLVKSFRRRINKKSIISIVHVHRVVSRSSLPSREK
ncbi:hypothetical protein PUN28_009250 [Cardiocondyla obscurior]|uniref:Uncharacterized protein n=1 Tax=Cardiocondyla obscurior TaxID=286306 RepID=A0AAW2FSK9_9HYME